MLIDHRLLFAENMQSDCGYIATTNGIVCETLSIFETVMNCICNDYL